MELASDMEARVIVVSFKRFRELASVRLNIPVVPRGTEEEDEEERLFVDVSGRDDVEVGTADDDDDDEDEDDEEEEEERTEVAVREDVVVEEMAEAAVMLVDDTDLVELVDESRDEERAEERPLRPPISANVASPVEEAAVCPMVDASTPLSTIGGDGYGRRSGPRNISRNSIHSLIS